jgi:hypothetical protein
LRRVAVSALPKIALAASPAKKASPAGVFAVRMFDGPKLVANAIPPFSSLNANTKPNA